MTFERNVPLAPLTTLRVGGSASFFIQVHSTEDLREAIGEAKRRGLRFTVLGGGSNIVIPDSGFNGLVIQNAITGIACEETDDSVFITAGAGEVWDALVADTISHGLFGLENLSGIPGSVGGTPVQNVGAYGVEVQSVIEWVEVYDAESDSMRKMSNAKCQFAYRDSIFKHDAGKNLIVTRVQYHLRKTGSLSLTYKDIQTVLTEKNISNPSLTDIREIVLQIRAKKFPNLAEYGTAGSFFKNPIIEKPEYERQQGIFPELPSYPASLTHVKIPIGFILEKLGYKGKREGNVGFYEHHSLVLVNYGNATASEILSFAKKVVDHVKTETGIEIEMEVRTL